MLCLSGSRCRLKKVVHQAAAQAKAAGARVLSVTDASDRELSARSALSVLVPGLTGIVAAPLMLALFEWVIYQTACERERAARSEAVLPANSRQAQP